MLLAGLGLLGAVAATGRATENVTSTPFNPRSGPAGKTMFTALPASRTGLVTVNRYDDPRMFGALYREFLDGAIGTGVAVGDYDGDGKPDIFIVNKVGSGRLYRNLGDFHFVDVTRQAGLEDDSGAWKEGATFVDVNNDGRLDLYVCRFNAPNRLYINQGNGTFKEEAHRYGLDVVDACGMACFADYDRDGWLDVYIQTNLRNAASSPLGQRDYLYHNNGNGTFTNVTDAAGILAQPTQGHSATWWDYNEDGWPDLYVANDFETPDFLYRNNRDGTFTNVIDRVLPHMPYSSMGSDEGDVDNDGHIDLLAVDMAGTTREFTQRGLATSRARFDPQRNERMNAAIQLYYNALYLNTGASRCLEAAHLAGIAGTNWTWSPRFEDLNNDGRLDLFVTNGMVRELNNEDLVAKQMTALDLGQRILVMKNSPVLNQANLAYENLGHLRFKDVGREWGLDQVGVSFGAAFGDFDGDGDMDLVYVNYQGQPTILRNDGQTGNSVIIALRGTASNRFGVGARVEATTKAGTQVRELVLARGYLSQSEPVLHFGFGDDHEIRRLRIFWPSGRTQTLEDLPTGRKYTITEPGGPAASQPQPWPISRPRATQFEDVSRAVDLAVAQREEKLEGTVAQPLLPRRFNRRGPGIAVGDLKGDGVAQIVLGATSVDGAKILAREGSSYRSLAIGAIGAVPDIDDGPPLIFDANGDGTNDLLFTAGGAAIPAGDPDYQPRLWLNHGRGGFDPAPPGFLPSERISVGAAVAADFDHDGRLDLFLGGRLLPGDYPAAPASALLMQRDGRLVDETDRLAPGLRKVGLVTSALATDVDGDGWVDLVVATEWGGVHFFRNEQGHGFVDESAQWGFDTAGSGFWTSIAAGDFNHDGHLDYAVGNLGLNTEYTASRRYPLRLFVHDFAGSGQPQLVEALDVDGSLLPVASRDELAAAIPGVLRRYPSDDRYAAATLDQILGKEALAKARVWQVGELRSGVLLSQPAGGYQFVPLPRYAQIAPVQGMVAADFNGDGNCDLLLVTNEYSPIPAIGPWDSGLGWQQLGDGDGGFTPVPAEQSGWLVPGDAKALALVDLDGDGRPDAMLSRNNQSTMAFRDTGSDASLPIAVRLHGRGGNPDAIGARIALVSGDRTLQVRELHAGGGFASQSTTTAFFSVPPGLAAGAEFDIRWPRGATTKVACPQKGGYLNVNE